MCVTIEYALRPEKVRLKLGRRNCFQLIALNPRKAVPLTLQNQRQDFLIACPQVGNPHKGFTYLSHQFGSVRPQRGQCVQTRLGFEIALISVWRERDSWR